MPMTITAETQTITFVARNKGESPGRVRSNSGIFECVASISESDDDEWQVKRR